MTTERKRSFRDSPTLPMAPRTAGAKKVSRPSGTMRRARGRARGRVKEEIAPPPSKHDSRRD
jgi:hypothetical protein